MLIKVYSDEFPPLPRSRYLYARLAKQWLTALVGHLLLTSIVGQVFDFIGWLHARVRL